MFNTDYNSIVSLIQSASALDSKLDELLDSSDQIEDFGEKLAIVLASVTVKKLVAIIDVEGGDTDVENLLADPKKAAIAKRAMMFAGVFLEKCK